MSNHQSDRHAQAQAEAMKRDFENARDGRIAKAHRTGAAEGLSPPPALDLKPHDIRAKDAQRWRD